MGLDIGENKPSDGGAVETTGSLRDIVESAVQSALRLKQNSITFNTVALKGREAELATVTADLQKQYPALQEIVPGRVNGATAYLNEKPNKLKKFLLSFSTSGL